MKKIILMCLFGLMFSESTRSALFTADSNNPNGEPGLLTISIDTRYIEDIFSDEARNDGDRYRFVTFTMPLTDFFTIKHSILPSNSFKKQQTSIEFHIPLYGNN